MLRKKLKLNDASDEEASTSIEKPSDVKIIENPVEYSIVFEKMLWEKLWCIEEALCMDLMSLDYKKDKRIAAVYNPLDYAADLHKNYLRKFLKKAPIILFLGMNPGPFGMCQTGVPFGNVSSVKKWMKLEGVVKKPEVELAPRQIDGLNCKREEQSGKRFWGVLEELCGVSENFFHQCYVHNLCPLAFLELSGKNITPPEIKCEAKKQLHDICLDYLRQTIDLLNPQIIISVGTYANDRIKELKKKNLLSESIDCKLIPHPSPRALHNSDWIDKAKKWYIDNDIMKYFNNEHP